MSVSVWIYKKLGMKKIEYFENSPKKTSLELAYYFLGGGGDTWINRIFFVDRFISEKNSHGHVHPVSIISKA